MPLSKGKHYILTILDSFSWHLIVIPCTDDWQGSWISSFKWSVKNFCEIKSVMQHLHCHCPQSSSNIKPKHHKSNNTLYMLCKERNCKWTNVHKSVASSMNSATGISPHYIITGWLLPSVYPNYPTATLQMMTPPHAYDMLINVLLWQVRQR